jgi:hypothetical protein
MNRHGVALVLLLAGTGCSSTDGVTRAKQDGSASPDPTKDPGPGAPNSGVFDGVRIDLPDRLMAVYSPSYAQTIVGAARNGPTSDTGQSLQIRVRGKQTGTFSCGDEPDGGLTISMNYSTNEEKRSAGYVTTGSADLTPCTIVISEYGAVGEPIRGTFSGTFVATTHTAEPGTPPLPLKIMVTGGVFDIVRGADVP